MAGFAALGQDSVLLQHSSRGAVFGYQIAAIAVTLAIAVVGGSLAGWVVSTVNLADQTLTPAQLFDDGTFWTVWQHFRLYMFSPLDIIPVRGCLVTLHMYYICTFYR